jgi:hypothetical protein
MQRKVRVWMIAVAVLLGMSTGAFGAYHHMDEKDAPKFQQIYPDKAGTKLDDCALCHAGNTYTTKSGTVVTESVCQFCHKTYGYDGTGDITKTLNPYGAAYNAAGRSVAAFAAIENVDSDNDTYSNKTEIDAVRYPGDKLDTPAKIPAPHIILSLEELESVLTPHEQFMLMNTSRGGETGFDFYATYTGFIMQELLEAAGWKAASTGVTVTAPDGYSYTYARTSTGSNYPIEGTYPQAQYFYDATADSASGGWVDYSAPGCTGRTNGQIISVTNGLRLLLAYKANGTYLDIAYQDDQNKLVGEGPFRAVPPQWRPGYPDRQATSATPAAEPWPYDKTEQYTDHNAGFSARGVAAIRVDPLPDGTTEYDWRNSQTDAGWGFLNDKKIVVYGNLRNGNVKGKVTTGLVQKPLANALVYTGTGGYETLTDDNGEFLLQGVLSGPDAEGKTYSISASAEGYRSQTEDVTVTDGDNQTVEFRLVPGSDNRTLCPIRNIDDNETRINIFRKFRDRVVAKSETGKKYIRAYYCCAPEVTLRLLADRGLRGQAADLLQIFAAPARTVAAGNSAIITRPQLQKIAAFTTALKKGASRRLALLLERFEFDLTSGRLQTIVPYGIEQ